MKENNLNTTHALDITKHLLVSGIMCYNGCGKTIEKSLNLDEFKQQKLLTPNAQILIDAEPQTLGIHRLTLRILDEEPCDENVQKKIVSSLIERLHSKEFTVLTEGFTQRKTKQHNRINIAINLLSFLSITTLFVLFPPTLFLTLAVMGLSFLTTAFTARSYLIAFVKNLRHKQMTTMPAAITLGWLLSLTHAIYHAIIMPLTSAFSMVFMSYLMPILLIGVINGMDELRQFILKKSQKMQLRGIKSLLQQMSDTYLCAYPSDLQKATLSHIEQCPTQYPLLSTTSWETTMTPVIKSALQKGMLITVQRGECFPVDGLLVEGNTLIDASLLTGEPHQMRSPPHAVPAGAINLGQKVTIYAQEDSYHSTINRLLFRANRTYHAEKKSPSRPLFTTLYAIIIILGMIAAIITPFALGILTLPLLLQNITSILFTICPCTLTIAYQLPKLLSQYQRHQKGVILRNDELTTPDNPIHTIVFDKTGTLTTGNSQVESNDGLSTALWRKVYLLEKNEGGEHPLAKAITNHCETTLGLRNGRINDIKNTQHDPKNRGLSADVQGTQIHIGNLDYLMDAGLTLPAHLSQRLQQKSALGYTPIYVAEKKLIQGVIFIKHEIRPGVITALQQLKREGKTLILLTGDHRLSALGFNQQNGSLFTDENIHAEQTPADKETFLKNILRSKKTHPSGIWFIGDGLNDAACARIVSSEGGVSCAITPDEKVAYFTDLSLDGTLDYLFQHDRINRYVKKNTQQNQGIILCCAVTFLALIVSFSMLGMAIPPLIPLAVMLSATLFSLANSYRIPAFINKALAKQSIDTARSTRPVKETIRQTPFHRLGNHFFPRQSLMMRTTESVLKSDTLKQCQTHTTNTMGLPT